MNSDLVGRVVAAQAAPEVEEKQADYAGQVLFPTHPMLFGGGGSEGGMVNRAEAQLDDCEVEGKLPLDLDGAFYRVGPDPQYPKAPGNEADVLFDGEGHASMFRFKDGHVDYRSRFVRNERWRAQREARRSLFGMYRNPNTDDASVEGKNRGTANTQMWFHHGKLMALKEDSPPVLLDPVTLEVIDDAYKFGGALQGETFTAHPKIDSETGELLGYGYEAKGFGSDDVEIFSVDKTGKQTWHCWIKVPYVGMIHDFAVTNTHVALLVMPLAMNWEQIKNGGVHWAWDSKLPTYMGVMKRGGDGSDLRWFEGQQMMATHTMGCWSEGEKVIIDMDGGDGNQFPFFPSVHEPFSPEKARGQLRRITLDLADRTRNTFGLEILFPEVEGALARQDDRYHTRKYRYGYMLTMGPQGRGWVTIDHQTGTAKTFWPGADTALAEMCFVPRRPDSPEGDGYLIGVSNKINENGRSDLLIVDAMKPDEGPVARVKLPFRAPMQVHGYWVDGSLLPPPA